MKNRFLRCLCFLFIITTIANPGSAQFGLKDKLKKKKSSDRPAIDFKSEKMSAAPLMSTMLSRNGIRLTHDGKLTSEDLWVAFLPGKLENGEHVKYDEYEKEKLYLTANVIDEKNNKNKGTFHFSVNPVTRLGSQLTQKRGNKYNDFVQLEEGSYRMEFYNDDNLYYSFPFRVVAKVSDDHYAALDKLLFLEGLWNDWNYFEIDKQGYFIWHHFMNNQTTYVENEFRVEKIKPYGVRYELLQGNKIIGIYDSRNSGSKDMELNNKPDYQLQDATRTRWENIGIQLAQLPGKLPDVWNSLKKEHFSDGQYTMKVHLKNCEGKEWTNTFKFQVVGGNFIGDDQQNRKKNKDKTTLIEGGRDQVWMKRI